MNLFELFTHVNTSENAIQMLRERGILRSVPPQCPIPELSIRNCGKSEEYGRDGICRSIAYHSIRLDERNPTSIITLNMVNLMQIHEACKSNDLLLVKLREWGLILNDQQLLCPKCGNGMKVSNFSSAPEGKRWYCGSMIRKHKSKAEECKMSIRFRRGTFFAQMKLTMFQALGFAHLWSRGISLVNIMHEIDISNKSAVDWASFCREVLLNAYIANAEKIGGQGCTVEIDESKFGKRKYHRGHAVEGSWVFGGVERESGKVFMEVVEKRDANTLLPLIRKWIEPGTTIISDCWKAYSGLHEYNHLTVNHSENYVDPNTNAHTNRIESIWRHGKESVGSHNRKKSHLPGNLARYVFMKSVRVKNGDFSEVFSFGWETV